MNVRVRSIIMASCVVAFTACGQSPAETTTAKNSAVDPYRAEVDTFRQQREAKLTSDTGWLTIAGLYFMTRPETTVGSGGDNDVVLPPGTPSRVGTFVLATNGK